MNGISVFLANAAFFYPAYWLSMFLVRAGPALLHVAFLGHRLVSFGLGPLWVEAACYPPGAFAAHETLRNSSVLEAGIVLGAVALALLVRRKHTTVSGLLIAVIGQAALTGPLLGLLFGRGHSAAGIAALCAYAAVVLVGLTLLSSSVSGGYLKRFTAPAIGFCLPLAIFSSSFIWLGADWRIIPIFTAPSLSLAAIAALWNRSPSGAAPVAVTFPLRRFAAGLALTLVFAAAIHAAQAVRDRSQQTARAAFAATLPKPAPAAAYPKIFFQRGVNFTAEGPAGYDPQSAVPLLDQLKTFGVDSIALVPYGFAEAKQPAIHFPGGMERTEDIEAISAA